MSVEFCRSCAMSEEFSSSSDSLLDSAMQPIRQNGAERSSALEISRILIAHNICSLNAYGMCWLLFSDVVLTTCKRHFVKKCKETLFFAEIPLSLPRDELLILTCGILLLNAYEYVG